MQEASARRNLRASSRAIAWRWVIATLTLAIIAAAIASANGALRPAIRPSHAWWVCFAACSFGLAAGAWATPWRGAGLVGAALILGLASQLGLIVHDWFDTIVVFRPSASRRLMWAFVALQAIIAAWALAPKAARDEAVRIVRTLGAWRMLVIAALVIRANILPLEIAGAVFLVVVVNVMLGIFNLIPIPPLDGSKVLSALLPQGIRRGYDDWRAKLEFNPFLGMGLVLLLILVLGGTFGSFIYAVARALAGM